MVSKYRINHCWVFSVQQKKNTKQVNFMFYFQNLKNTYANDTRLCLFFEIHFLKNYFSNFLIFVCHQKSWSTENTFQSKENLAWFRGKCFSEKFGRKIFFENYEKFKNIILFADYIKFGPQTFVLNIYFLISSLKI